MKGLIAAVLLTVSEFANAGVITLGPTDCGTLKTCTNVPNDAGVTVNIYGAPQYQWFYVYVGQTEYYVAVPSNQADGVVMESFVFPNPYNPAIKQFTGQYITVTLEFTSYTTYSRSGRGQHYTTHWSLVGGTIIQ
jgi:hypothetical protein